MIEELTEEELIAAQEAEQMSDQSLAQLEDQISVEDTKKLQEQADQAAQKLSEIPENVINGLKDAQAKLMKIINGYENPKDPNYDPTADINKIISMLNPIVGQLKSLPVPSIPGLQQIQDLLSALMSSNSSKKPANPNIKLPPRPDISPDVLDMLQDLLVAIQSLCVALPLVMINLVFKMFDVVVKLFKQIAGVIGVPSIPFPLTLVGTCLSLVPDLLDFVVDAPGKITRSVKGVVMQQLQASVDAQVPSPPEGIKQPQTLVPSPNRKPPSTKSSTNANASSKSTTELSSGSSQISSQGQQQETTQTTSNLSAASQASSNSIVNIIEEGPQTTDSPDSRY